LTTAARAPMSRVVTLTTDFGTADGYVGEMKGVLLSLGGSIQIVDITHEIPPQDVEFARITVARTWRRFPAGTIHIVVVDPGVGSSRDALAVESDQRFLVGPDNGVLSPALFETSARAVALPIPKHASSTFHGRDVFAPAAALLARGESLDSLGTPALDPVVRRTPAPVRRPDGAIEGEIIAIDRFGNAITNLAGIDSGIVSLRDLAIPVRHTYADAPIGTAVAVVGSSDLLEVAIRNDNAARALGISRGDKVIVNS
jgi:S-adenosyl-L-methionine hydrolase (adenosine-forming)